MVFMPAPVPCSILLITDWFDNRFHHGVARFAREHGWHLSLEAAYDRSLPWGWQGDGAVAMVSSEETAKFVRSLKVPVVDSSHAWPGLRLPRVHEDDEAIGGMAARYFLERGFLQLAFCSPGRNPVACSRRDGFAAAAKAAGAAFLELLPAGAKDAADEAGSWVGIRHRLTRSLAGLGRPTGVFCVDDRTAAMVCEIAKNGRLDIPGRVSVLGVGNLEIACECSWVPLSSIQVDSERGGYEAARLLQEVLDGKHGRWPLKMPPVRRMAPAGIVERASTQGVAAQDPHLARAVARLFAHPTEDLSIQALAAHAKVGHQKLYELFAREFRCTPGEFSERIRLRLACQLLADSPKKLCAVAQESGFGSTLRLHRAFMRKLGASPGRWRKSHAAGQAQVPAILPERECV